MAVGETLNIFVKISGAGQFGKLNKAISTSNNSAMKLNKSLKTTSVDFGTIAAAAASLGAVAFPVKAAADYETAVTDVARAVEMTSSQQIQLSKNLMAMHGGSVEELSEIAAGLGRAGVQYKELAGVTQVVAKGVTALGMSAEHTTDAIASITNLNQWQMTANVVGRVGDLFAHLENTTAKVKAADLANVWGRAASSFKTAGIEAAESQAGIAAWAMSMSNSPELAGSMIKQFIKRLPDASREFSKLTGQNVDFYGQLKDEGAQGIINVVNRIKKAGLDIRGVQKVLSKSGAYDMFQRLSDDKAQKTLLKSIENASQATGAMDREFAKTMSTFNYQLSYLRKQFTNLLAIIGEPMMSALKPILSGFSGILKVFGRLITMFPNLSKYLGITTVAVIGLTTAGFGLALSVAGASKAMGFMRQSLGIMRYGLITTISAVRSLSAAIARNIIYLTRQALLMMRSPIKTFTLGIGFAAKGLRKMLTLTKAVTIAMRAQAATALLNPYVAIAVGILAVIALIPLFLANWNSATESMIGGFKWVMQKIEDFASWIQETFIDLFIVGLPSVVMSGLGYVADGINWAFEKMGWDDFLDLSGLESALEKIEEYGESLKGNKMKELYGADSIEEIDPKALQGGVMSDTETWLNKKMDSGINMIRNKAASVSKILFGADETANQAKALTQEMQKNAEVREEFLIPKNKTTGKAEIDVNIGLTDELKMQAIEAVTSRADLSVKVREIALTPGV